MGIKWKLTIGGFAPSGSHYSMYRTSYSWRVYSAYVIVHGISPDPASVPRVAVNVVIKKGFTQRGETRHGHFEYMIVDGSLVLSPADPKRERLFREAVGFDQIIPMVEDALRRFTTSAPG